MQIRDSLHLHSQHTQREMSQTPPDKLNSCPNPKLLQTMQAGTEANVDLTKQLLQLMLVMLST